MKYCIIGSDLERIPHEAVVTYSFTRKGLSKTSSMQKNADAFLPHAMGASAVISVNADRCYCDNGAVRHFTTREKKTAFRLVRLLGKKNVLMQAYG